MIRLRLLVITLLAFVILSSSCKNKNQNASEKEVADTTSAIEQKLAKYVKVKLTADLSVLSEKEKQMLPLLFEAAQLMNDIYWMEAYGDKETLLNEITDEATKEFVLIN